MARTVINVRGMERMGRLAERGLQSTAPSPVRDAFRQWDTRYSAAMRERYDRFSRGQGNWKSLAESTKERRRHGKGALARAETSGGGQVSILRDTGTLFAVWRPALLGVAGKLSKHVPFGIVVGYGGPATHPAGKMTIARLAEIHHTGEGRMPERKLLVPPAEPLKRQMASDMERALAKIIRRSQVPPA
jgi:hypothetical protein